MSFLKLPVQGVLLGGCILAFLASAVNVSFMIQLGTSVSHLTGDLARFSMDLRHFEEREVMLLFLTVALFGFVTGSGVSGYLIHHPTMDLSRPYGRSISFIGGLFILAYLCLGYFETLAVFFGAVACGFQNALATHFRGIVLRTTHVTGLLTDLGVALGMKLRGHVIDSSRIRIPFYLSIAFFAGAMFGGILVPIFHGRVILLIGILYLLGGGLWSLFKRLRLGVGIH